MDLNYPIEVILKFVRSIKGDEYAESIRNDEDALGYWDFKMHDWATD
jgi:hypothetical protein